jgi:hypothetical protein
MLLLVAEALGAGVETRDGPIPAALAVDWFIH